MDLYIILGISKGATEEDIKRAYRRKAVEHHPDKGGNTQEFQKATQAYDLLMDAEKRRRYDSGESFDSLNANKIDPSLNICSQLFIQIVQSANLEHDDIFDLIKRNIESTQANIAREISKQNNLIRRYEIALKRLSKDREGIFATILNNQINQSRNQISAPTDQAAVGLQAIEFIKDCEYTTDPRVNVIDGLSIRFTTSPTGGIG